jgi:hypothetical protein
MAVIGILNIQIKEAEGLLPTTILTINVTIYAERAVVAYKTGINKTGMRPC